MNFIQIFGLILLVTVIFSFIVKWLKQPIIIGYILSGVTFSIFVAESGTGKEQIIILSELGITFLLFLMGLEFDFKNLKYLGKDILISTIWQSVFFFAAGYGVSWMFGFSAIESVYLAILFMFSSTLLVAKWIEDKKETTTIQGKITFGILVVQDILAILALTILSLLQQSSWTKVVFVPIGGILLIGTAFIFAKYILNYLLKFAVKYPELLFIFSLGICFFFVEISPLLGYSTTIGAYIAGVTIANSNYKTEIAGRLKPLITFFNMLFFVGLGFQMTFGFNFKIVAFIAVICLLSFILKPFIIYATLRNRGYDTKISATTGIDLAQMSEFGIIIVAAGVLMKTISNDIATISILSVIISMVVSSYMIKYDKTIYNKMTNKFREYFNKLDKAVAKELPKEEELDLSNYNILFFGYYDIGKEVFEKLNGMGKKMLVIENDPSNIEILKQEKIHYVYNSVANPYFFNHLNFEKTDLIVSSIIDLEETKMIINNAKTGNPHCVTIVTAKSLKNALALYEVGADYVIYPTYVNEQQVSVLLEDYTTDINKVITKKIHDITKLREMDHKHDEAMTSHLGIDWMFKKKNGNGKIINKNNSNGSNANNLEPKKESEIHHHEHEELRAHHQPQVEIVNIEKDKA